MGYKILLVFFLVTGCWQAFFSLTASALAEALPTDDIVIKAADAEMFQITANMKLTSDQISAVRAIITDNIVKERNLQQDLQDGNIDGKTMYDQKRKLINDRNQALSQIFSPDQMKIWMNMQQYQ